MALLEGAIRCQNSLLREASESWRYRLGGSEASEPVSAWRQPDFVEDASWSAGASPLGFGDGDDATVIEGMQGNYPSLYFRHEFEIAPNEIPGSLQLDHYADDGVAVWINGTQVLAFNVSGEVTASTTADGSHEAEWETAELTGIAGLLVEGRNVIAAQVFNSTVGGSDLSFDLRLIRAAASDPDPEATPGRRNSVYSETAPPNVRQVEHSPKMPKAGEPVQVSVKVTDPQGVGSAVLHYQVIDPGEYIRLTDETYETSWVDVPMNDSGEAGDATAGDDIFTATLPAEVQVHRRLVRYRITVADTEENSVRIPFNDDTQPNFAYFVYNGVPDWEGSLRPGSEPVVTYPASALTQVPVYHLISLESDVLRCHYTGPNDGVYRYYGTFVYDGDVYDHVRYRIKGQASTRATGKNKTKINFNLGHRLQARDNYGRPYKEKWDKFALHTGTCPWFNGDQSTGGMVLNEAAAFKFYNLLDVPASNTHFFHLRIIDDAVEADPSNQYEGDFWGLSIAIEEPDTRFINERGLPDGNMYKMNGGPTQTNQGGGEILGTRPATDLSRDLARTQDLAWWQENIDITEVVNHKVGTTLVNNTDARADWNALHYHNPETGKWSIFPWDLDLTWESKNHWRAESVWENFQKVFRYDEAERELNNRAREAYDLLVTSGEGARAFEELARMITTGADDKLDLIHANQAMWDYHSRTVKKGIWYKNNPRLPAAERNWDGLLNYYKTYVSDDTTYAVDRLLNDKAATTEPVPDKPTISYAGAAGFPVDGLVFQTSAYAATDKPTEFAGIEWRIGEITDPSAEDFDATQPWVYEITPVWESGTLTDFASSLTLPASAVNVGGTYRARVRHLGASGQYSHWSDPVEFTAAVPDTSAYVGKLLVSEVMYQPAPPTAEELAADATFTASSFEFIEIMNTGTTALDLSNVRFTKGVEFDFVNATITSIAPGQRVVIVGNLAAFNMRYGSLVPAPVVAGTFDKNLSNAGERLKLSYGAGIPLVDFEYGDDGAWPDGADREGQSLVLVRPTSSPDSSQASAWRESALAGGSPGFDDAIPFTGDPAADADGDRLSAFAEYAFGTSDNHFDSSGALIGATIDMFTDDGTGNRLPRLELSFQWRAAADAAAYSVETSTDLVTWVDATSTMILQKNHSNGDGTQILTFRQSEETVGPVVYARVRVTSAQ
ncbi:MAG: CotH kinase family protein [Verrucomicrobiales bacterium]